MARVPSAAAARIGQRILRARTDMSWTADELAVESGIDSASIRSYENGRAMLSVKTLIQIARTLDKDPGWFLEEVKIEEFSQPREAVRDGTG